MTTPLPQTDPVAALVRTPAEGAALDALRAAAGGALGPLELHSARVFELARRLAPGGDREVLLVAALLHDIAALPALRGGPGPYVSDARRLAAELLAPLGWEDGRRRRCLDAIERHHELRRQDARGAEVEALRRADLVDVSGGRIRFGLDRSVVAEVDAAFPRDGFARALAGIVGGLIREQPRTLLRIVRPS